MSQERPEPPDVTTGKHRRRPRRDAARVTVILSFAWSIAMLSAVVIAGIANFLEVQRACENGLGASGAGRADVTYRTGIAVACRTRGGTIEIPMNGASATVLFGAFGLAVTVLLMVAYGLFRRSATDDRAR